MKFRFTLLFFAIFATTLLCISSPSHAFIFIRAGIFQKGERPVARAPLWNDRTVHFVINTDQTIYGGTISPELNSTEFSAAVTAAVQSWTGVCGSNIKVSVGGTTSSVKDSNDTINTISWDNRTTAEGNMIASTNTLAVAYSAVIPSNDTYTNCDIVVNGEASGNFGINAETAKYDLISILAHEIGHCLGLDHSVESPTFTSTNSILLNATMASTVSAGDITKRIISQDEIDGMECVNPTGKSSKSGSFCGSYHGTSGGGALSGVIGGGPLKTIICGASIPSTAFGKEEEGSGCITKAFGDEKKSGINRSSFFNSWMSEITLLIICYALFRLLQRKKKPTIVFIAFLGSYFCNGQKANALTFDVGGEVRRSNPVLINQAASLTDAEANFSKIDPQEKYKFQYNTLVSLFFLNSDDSSFGVFGRYFPTHRTIQKGYNTGGTLLFSKNTRLNGLSVGVAGRYYFIDKKNAFRIFIEGLFGFGKVFLDQKITAELTGLNSNLEAAAWSAETTGNLGFGFQAYDTLFINLKAGYSRLKTNAFSTNKVSGSNYSGLSEGKRVMVTSTGTDHELSFNQSGFTVSASVEYSF